MKFSPSERVAIGFMMDLTRGRYSPCKTPQWFAFDFFDRLTASEIKVEVRRRTSTGKALVMLDRSFSFYYQGKLVAMVFMYGKRVGMARCWKTDQNTKWRIRRVKYALKFWINDFNKPVKWVSEEIPPLPSYTFAKPLVV